MKLATRDNGSLDGELMVVSRDLERWLPATGVAATLQGALDNWQVTRAPLHDLSEALNRDLSRGVAVDWHKCRAPLPRAFEWLDGSAYINHVKLVRKARGAAPPPGLETDPLVYQGGSSHFLGSREPFRLQDPNFGLDFEGEVAVILDETPEGSTRVEALSHIALVLLANDWTYRNLVARELEKGFGFLQSKPATSFSPVAVTPDELGEAWRDARLHLPLLVWQNGKLVGRADAGSEMHFSFADLVEHIARTRSFSAGTLLGSGTVSNADEARGYSCIAEKRAREMIELGQPRTEFLKAGDQVRIEMLDDAGQSIFGAIAQAVESGETPQRRPRHRRRSSLSRAPLGITKLIGLHYYVRDLERSRRFYAEQMDFAEVARSSDELEAASGQRSLAFAAGEALVMCSSPTREGGRASRFLARHPDGVGTIAFEVEDIDRTFSLLEERGGTPITGVQRFQDDGGTLATFSITTPFGDTTFRFIERRGYRDLMPGIPYISPAPAGGNSLGFTHFDHITSNFQTMKPALLWLEHVLGFERFWEVSFHTGDITANTQTGSGLRSVVMWEPQSGVRFANNEPWRPFFKSSQINLFNLDHHGDGVQHAALATQDIIGAVRKLRQHGVKFMPTPAAYYDLLPARLERSGVGHIDEDLAVLRELEILVDGASHHQYLLQLFLEESASYHRSSEAGPFFYELIQRKGDPGFGAGNFRALFESIEHGQQQARRL